MATDLDYRNGDKIGLPATNTDPHNSETVIVENYDPNSGLITLTEPLRAYHYGADAWARQPSTPIDMRAEVLLLSSNVNITASTDAESMTPAYPRPYGCQVLVADFFEPSDFSYRQGEIRFDNVAIFNCSQEKTDFAGLKFHYAVRGTKTVTNSAISSGLGKGVIINSSQNVNLQGNVIHDFILHGVEALNSQVFTVDQNVVNQVRPVNEPFPAYNVWPEVNGGMKFSKCNSFAVTNNIVASTWHSGFTIPAYSCGGTQPHTGNVAHSIAGYGLIVKGSGSSACSEFSDFGGYKNRIATVHMGGGTGSALNVLHDVTSIDSHDGIMALGSGNGRVEVSDSVIIGSQNMENLDCPNFDRCSACIPRRGLWIPTFGAHFSEIPLAPKYLPYMFKQGGSWEGSSLFKNIKFIGFDSAFNDCGASQAAITTNFKHPDFHPLANFEMITFMNTDESAMFAFDSPPQSWANLSDCWTFTCTGLYNVLSEFRSTTYSGVPMAFGMPRDFQVTSDNKESVSVQVIDECVEKPAWNAYLCQKTTLGILLFESQDADRMDRSSQPIYIQDEVSGFNNRLNAYMDHGWDGAYTS